MKIVALLFCCTLAFIVEAQNNANPIVQTAAGPVKGSKSRTRLGKDFYLFRGIRYGEAPIGRNRFKAPVPVKSHTEVFDATQDGPSCPQVVTNNRIISEDCLRLNVYTRSLPQTQVNHSNRSKSRRNVPLKDVVVFLHHGGFYENSGTTFDFDPKYLLDRDIILVTINYRLVSFGWMSIGDERAPGNAGLKDQILALRWVQQNIRNFGGNPNSVTLMGYSAGSWSISLHMIAPISSGLFHRAIMMSGSSINSQDLPRNQRNIAIIQAQALNCPTDTNDKMMECFYEKSTDDFVKSLTQVFASTDNPILLWTPVIEHEYYGNVKNEQPFLTTSPVELFQQRKGNFVPLMTGCTKEEFKASSAFLEEAALKGDNSGFDKLNNRWDEVVPIYVGYESNTLRSHFISKEFREFYTHNETIGVGHWAGTDKLWTDSVVFQIHRMERLMTTYTCQPVYNYMFAYAGCESFAKWSNGTNIAVGHQDELLLLFKMGQFPEVCQRDIKTLERLTGMVENFAKTGRPIPDDNQDYSNVNWETSTKDHPKYLVIDEELSMVNGIIYEDRMSKWDELFPLPLAADPAPCPDNCHGHGHDHHHNHNHHHNHQHHH